MTNRWRRFVWLSIGIDYQYQSIDWYRLVSIGCRLTEPESTHKKHKFVRSNCKHISILNNLHVGNRRKGVQGVTYFVLDIILGPTVLAKTVGPKIMSSTKYVTPCTPFHLFPTCKSASVGAVLRNVKFICLLCRYIYRSLTLYCKTPVSHTKRVVIDWSSIGRYQSIPIN